MPSPASSRWAIWASSPSLATPTLPYHLYQQLGAYRNDASDVTALILLLLSLALYTLIEHLAHAPARKP